MKKRWSLFMVVGMLVIPLLTFWLVLSSGTESAGAASAEMPAGTIVGGTITTDTTWTLAGSPYILQTQNVIVTDTVKLTIEAGVVVEFNAARNLWVNGILLAVGTPTQPITFTRLTGGTQPWGALQIGGGSLLTDSNASQISYATIEGGGSGAQMLYVYNSAPTLDHLTLRNSYTRGLYVGNVSTSDTVSWDTGSVSGNTGEGIFVATGHVALSNLIISGNGGDGVELSSAHDSQLLNSSVQGNGGDGIRSNSDRLLLQGLTIGGNTGYGIFMQDFGANSIVRDTMVQDNAVAARLHPDVALENVTWSGNTRSEIEWTGGQVYTSRNWRLLPEINTYRVLGDIWSRDNALLSVEPGVRVQLEQYVSLKAMGGLRAVGTPSQPITFTLAPAAAHPWGMIEIGGGTDNFDSAASQISYATIEGGGHPTTGRLVHLYYTSAKMDHVTVRNSNSVGIQISPFAGTRVTLDTVAVTNSAGVAIYHWQPGPSLSYRNLTLQGNGTDAVSMANGSILSPMEWDLADAGVPVRTGNLSISGGGMLALMPGTRLEFTSSTGLEVWFDSSLYVLGTAESPITLTGVLSQPGAWKGIWLHPRARAILRNCNVEYGGASGEPALKIQSPTSLIIVNSAVRYTAGDGFLVDHATPPLLRNNDISGNAFGVRNARTAVPVDAREVWWGDASGPYHATLNPGGLGNAVSDGVLFTPWLTSVPTGTVPLAGLIVRTAGPQVASPGQSVIFGAVYLNETGQDIHDAVLVLVLPEGASFVEAYPASIGEGRGIYWSDRHHVFWRLGTVPAGAAGTVATRVRFHWGLPAHTETMMAMMGGSDPGLMASSIQGGAQFDLPAYLAHTPIDVFSTTVLTPAEVDAERQAYPALDDFYLQGLAQGYQYTSAERYAITGGRTVVMIVLDRPNNLATTRILRMEQNVYAYIYDENSFTLRTVIGDMIYDRAIATVSFTGALGAGQRSMACAPASDRLLFDRYQLNVLPTFPAYASLQDLPPDYYQCFGNCMREVNRRRWWDRHWFLSGQLSPTVFMARELVNLNRLSYCGDDCQDNPDLHVCRGPALACGARNDIIATPCDLPTGRYKPEQEVASVCSHDNPSQVCIVGTNGTPRCAPCGEGTGLDCNKVNIRVAKDPNAKYGSSGDLLPGEVISYTITYENEGEGNAYGVYIEDQLSEHLEENTLVIGQGGNYLPTSRTILWEIGELGPQGSPTASGSVTFTVQLRTGLPGGTPVINQAIVYFPSVPEETPTNQVVNMIWPVVGVPMTATVQAGHSVSITLAGRDPGGSPLTFHVVDPPGRGALTGAAPDLTYTAPAGFAGQDFFTFKASNGITESRLAEVTILVVPDPADTTPPTVVWSVPKNNAIVGPISASSVFTDTIGPMYTPYLFVGFSEAIDASTVTTATLLLTKQDGTAIPITVSYDGVTGEAIVLIRQPLEPGTWYTVRVTQGIKDLVGNPMAADFVWKFRTAGGGIIYMPLVVRKP